MRSSSALACFVAAARGLHVFVLPLLHGGQVGEDQLGGDDLDVADRVDRARDVVDVVILEAADDLDDGVDFADVGEELVAQALAGARTLDQPAMSTNSKTAGISFWDFEMAESLPRRSSGTVTMPLFGSMVQKG